MEQKITKPQMFRSQKHPQFAYESFPVLLHMALQGN